MIPSLSVMTIVVAAALSSCGADGSDASTASPDVAGPTNNANAPDGPPVTTVEVKALDNTFVDEQVEVAAGTEVVWKNGGRNDHDIVPVAEGESWGIGSEGFRPGDSYSHVFAEPGEYEFYCTIHGTADVGMTGTIVVT